MKKRKFPLLILGMIFASLLLSACTGGAGITTSWPGLYMDPQSETVFVAQGTHVYAVNLTNGTEKWRFPAEANNKLSFYAPPTLTADGQLIAGAYNNNLYSINPQTGQQNWVFDQAKDKYIGSAHAAGEMIYAPNNNNKIYALDSNGSLSWEYKTEHAIWAQPLTDGERLYVASMDHRLYALDPASGSLIWESEDLGGAVVKSFAFDTLDVLYVGTLGEDLVAVSSKNGEILWQTALNGWVWSLAVPAEGTLFLGDQEGFVYAIDAATGAIIWNVRPDTGAGRAILSTPVLAGESLYFASEAGILYAVDAATGNPGWNKTIGGKIYSDLKLVGETILLAPNEFDSILVAVDLQGNNRWSFTPVK